VFTASDGNGPGIYLAAAFVDGRAVSVQTPSANDGLCFPVGTDPASGALMFDHQQPCPSTEPIDVAVPTAGLSDGAHELAVVLTDAARASATVFDQTITTSNAVPTPVPKSRGTVRARFTIHWHWQGIHTMLRSITAARVPRRALLTVSCAGRGCPKLALRSARAGRLGRLLTELRGRRFRAGNRLLITVTRPPQAPERVELTIRRGRVPRARLLTR
jgi:hypothetical protein